VLRVGSRYALRLPSPALRTAALFACVTMIGALPLVVLLAAFAGVTRG